MLWFKNKIAEYMLWIDRYGVSVCVMCRSKCTKEKLCGFFEIGEHYDPPTLLNATKYTKQRLQHEWDTTDGKIFKASMIIYIVVVGGYLLSILLAMF